MLRDINIKNYIAVSSIIHCCLSVFFIISISTLLDSILMSLVITTLEILFLNIFIKRDLNSLKIKRLIVILSISFLVFCSSFIPLFMENYLLTVLLLVIMWVSSSGMYLYLIY